MVHHPRLDSKCLFEFWETELEHDSDSVRVQYTDYAKIAGLCRIF